jgi:hypothetical protein
LLTRTKREDFDSSYIRNFCPAAFDSYNFVPSVGTSGGILIIWKSSKFNGQLVFQNRFALSIELTSVISSSSWILSNIYAPCSIEGRAEFLQWLNEVDMADDVDWLLVGDFNLICSASDRNKLGWDIQKMLDFNAAISNLRLEEPKLHGHQFTWTNMQSSPLLERLIGF